jgi:hypothetical protein
MVSEMEGRWHVTGDGVGWRHVESEVKDWRAAGGRRATGGIGGGGAHDEEEGGGACTGRIRRMKMRTVA